MTFHIIATGWFCAVAGLVNLSLAEERAGGRDVTSVSEQSGQFVYSCKDESFQKVLDAVAKHYGQKVVCGDAEMANRKVTADIKSKNFWHAVCETSRQSGIGFIASSGKTKGEAVFREGQPAVVACQAAQLGALALYAPVPLIDRSKSEAPKPGVILTLYSESGDYAESGIDRIAISSVTEKPQVIACSGLTTGATKTSWSFILPSIDTNKPSKISFTLAASVYYGRRDYGLTCRVGAACADKDIRIKITDIREQDGCVEINYTLEWDSGLNAEEARKNKELIDKWLAGVAPSKEDKKWAEALKSSGRVRLLDITEVSLKDTDRGVLSSKGRSWAKRVPGIDIHGVAVFDKPAALEGTKLILTVACEKQSDEEFAFSVPPIPAPEPSQPLPAPQTPRDAPSPSSPPVPAPPGQPSNTAPTPSTQSDASPTPTATPAPSTGSSLQSLGPGAGPLIIVSMSGAKVALKEGTITQSQFNKFMIANGWGADEMVRGPAQRVKGRVPAHGTVPGMEPEKKAKDDAADGQKRGE